MGCQGRLPGVRDCEALALRVALVKSPADLHLVGKKQQIYEITTECLTLPYDIAMFDCVESGAEPSFCRKGLAARIRYREESFRLGEFFARWRTLGR